MHPYRGILCKYIQSDGLYTIPDDQNTLTLQSANTNDAPKEPLLGPVTNQKQGYECAINYTEVTHKLYINI